MNKGIINIGMILVFVASRAIAMDCHNESVAKVPERLEEQLISSQEVLSDLQCQKDINWSHEASNVDLMLESMAEWRQRNPKSKKTKIAIIDSGLPAEHVKSLKSDLKVFDEHFAVLPISQSKDDHGLKVASLYSGDNYLYQNGEIGFYQVEGRGGDVNTILSENRILEACRAGFRIINYSLGSHFNMEESFEQRNPRIVESLREKGCLLIKAAGNRSGRNEDQLKAFDDLNPVITVASHRYSGGLSSFSDYGEISAPGEAIYVTSPNSKACGRNGKSFVNGTSFAAPYVGGIYANILEVLASSHKFNELSYEEQIEAINLIVFNDLSKGGRVDAYRSLVLAKSWVKSDFDLKDKESIQKTLGTRELCTKPAPSLRAFRKKSSICGDIPADELEKHVVGLLKENNIHLLPQLLKDRHSFKLSKQGTAAVYDYLTDYQYSHEALPSKNSLVKRMDLISLFEKSISENKELEKFLREEVRTQILNSSDGFSLEKEVENAIIDNQESRIIATEVLALYNEELRNGKRFSPYRIVIGKWKNSKYLSDPEQIEIMLSFPQGRKDVTSLLNLQ